jgi:signal transduction histidine kinase
MRFMLSGFVFRMIAPLLGVSTLLLCLGGFTTWYIHAMQLDASKLLSQSIASSDLSLTLENQLREIRTNLHEFALTNDPSYLKTANSLSTATERLLEASGSFDRMQEGRSLLEDISRQFVAFRQQFAEALAADAADQRRLIVQLDQTYVTKGLIPTAKQHREQQQARLTEVSNRNKVLADRVGLTLLFLVTCVATGGLVFGIAAARSVHRSIVELNIPVHAAAGSLNEVVGPLKIRSDSSLEEIRGTLDQMAARVGETVDRLQQSQNKILRAEQMTAIGQLAAGLAHEIRNPLTAMRSLIQLARQQGGAVALDDRDLEVLDLETTRLNDLVQSFLDFARPPKLSRELIDVVQVIHRTVKLIKIRAERQNIAISMIDPPDPIWINADPQQLQQVALNLLMNAMDAQPAGGSVQIVVRPIEQSSPGQSAEICMIDHGPGIAAEIADSIFDPFFSTKDTGTGIGLAVCSRIIKDHGGTIAVSNSASGGAVFIIRLPFSGSDSLDSQSPDDPPRVKGRR